MNVTLEQLLHGDRSVLFKINPGDSETPANISVATLKELGVAINVLHELVIDTHRDLEKAEKRIQNLEDLLNVQYERDMFEE